MKNVLRSTFGTLVVAAFLAITPPMYARGGHAGHRGHGHGHAAAAHVKGGHAGFRARGGRGHSHAVLARGHARYGGRAFYGARGGHWGGSSWYPYSGYSRYGYYGLGYGGYPYYGYGFGYRWGGAYNPYTGIIPADNIRTDTDTGPTSAS